MSGVLFLHMNDIVKKGLGGWLILVGIGVVINPINQIYQFNLIYKDTIGAVYWKFLITPNSESYIPYLQPLIISELIGCVIFTIASLYIIYLFFKEKKLFPKFFCYFMFFIALWVYVDAFFAMLVFPDEPLDSETIREMIQVIIVCSIWIPYMLVSKRVAATFINY